MLRLMLLWLALLAAPAGAQTFPKFTGLVVDAANVLPPEVEADLTAKLQKLQADTHRQLVVATIADLQGYPQEDYGYRLGREWGVGLRDVNNGAILFIAPNEPAGRRGLRIEVGSGLEPVLTDALTAQIVRDVVTPKLVAGDIAGGMEAGTDALIAQLRASPDEAKARTDAAVTAFNAAHRGTRQRNSGGVPVGLIFWGVILLFFILPALGRGRRGRRYGGGGGSAWPIVLWSIGNELGNSSRGGFGGGWSGGSSGGSGGGSDGGGSSWGGGGFSGGGGGSFGGGGASGSW